MKEKNLRLVRNSISAILLNRMLAFLNVKKNGVFIGKGAVLNAKRIEIGNGTRINGRIVIKGGGTVSLGKYCAIGDGVRIISSNHALNTASIQLALQKRLTGSVHMMETKSGVEIGHDVWIGDGAIILPGVSIGNGAVIGAGAIVTRSVEPYVVVAGNPARQIGRRFSEDVAGALDSLRWWDWSERQLRQAAFLFERPFPVSESDEVLKLIDQAKQRANV